MENKSQKKSFTDPQNNQTPQHSGAIYAPKSKPKFPPPPPVEKKKRIYRPASFWERSAAWLIDLLPFELLSYIFSSSHSSSLGSQSLNQINMGAILGGIGDWFVWNFFFLFVYALYHIAFEFYFQTTPGKYCIGLKVINKYHGSPDLKTSILRHFSAALSWVTLNIGHAFIQWRKDKLALHDLISQTQVVEDSEISLYVFEPLPSWAHQAFFWGSFVIQVIISFMMMIPIFIGLQSMLSQIQ